MTGHPPFVWTSSVGQFDLMQVDATEYLNAGGEPVRVDVPLVYMGAAVAASCRTDRPRELLRRVAAELRYFLSVLSLLNRGYVGWTRIEVQSGDQREWHAMKTTATWRTMYFSRRPDYLSPLVIPEKFPANTLDTLSKRLLELPGRDALAVAIPLLINTYGEGFIEEAVVAAFTALEAVASGLSQGPDPDAAALRNVLEALRKSLASYATQHELSESIVERVAQKLNGLPHVPIALRIAALIKDYHVEWRDLWAAGAVLETSLTESFKLRNALIHRGKLIDDRRAIPEATRIHILTERLILSALGFAPYLLYKHAYRHVEFVQRELLPQPPSAGDQT